MLDRLEAIGRVGRQGAIDHREDWGRNGPARGRPTALELAPQQFGEVAPGERHALGQGLEQGGRERELVACRRHVAAVMLLGRHVLRRADDRPRCGALRRGEIRAHPPRGVRFEGGHRLGVVGGVQGGQIGVVFPDQPKIDEFGDAVGREDDVVGLDVAVDEPRGVHGGQPGRDPVEDLENLGLARGRPLGQPRAQRAPTQVLHHDVQRAGLAVGVATARVLHEAEVVDRDDARMGEGGQGPGLAGHPLPGGGRVSVRQADDLDRDFTVELGIASEQHRAERSLAQWANDLVAPEVGPLLGATDQSLRYAGQREALGHLAGFGPAIRRPRSEGDPRKRGGRPQRRLAGGRDGHVSVPVGSVAILARTRHESRT